MKFETELGPHRQRQVEIFVLI